MDQNTISLRHTLATLAYRANRAVRNAPPEFGTFQLGKSTRYPVTILAHMGDLMDWALSIANDKQEWHVSTPLPWDQEVARFFASLSALDDRFASETPVACSKERLFQGPIADALSHVGQIAMFRRIAHCPAGGENYFVANIETGRVGRDQAPPIREFE